MNLGDFDLEATFDFQFGTTVGAVPTTLVGGTLSVYEGNTTAEITAGLTLTTDFDGKVGCHNIHVVATAANGFLTAKNYTLWLAAGTVGGVTVAPVPLAVFSLGNRLAQSPAANADGFLDRTDAIEVGVTPRMGLRAGLAADTGLVSGAENNAPEITAGVVQDKTRIAATTDDDGNRLTVTTDLT